jgi:hypothetical protein
MAHKEDDVDSASTDGEPDGARSRRDVLTAAGLAAAAVGLAPAKAAAAHAEEGRHLVGVAPKGTTAVEFRGRFLQSGAAGEAFTAVGYLIAAQGATDDDLFGGAPANETTALLTVHAAGDLVRRVLDQNVHSLDIEGSLTVYQRSEPGASFDDPGSFQAGTPVARFALTLQDVLTVFAPGTGIPTLTGDMRQTSAHRLSGPLGGKRLGHDGLRARLFATGLGKLTDPVTLNASLEMAGNWTLV